MQKLRNYFLILVFLLAPITHAQYVPDPISYVVSPETPGPYEEVRIETQGVGTFLGDADIAWTINGTLVKKGTGERVVTFTTGPLGSTSRVRVSIVSPTQGTFAKEFVFSPSVITLLWEANTTVPPLHRGKALYSAGSPVKVVAFPTVYAGSSRVAPSTLSYQWSLNGEPLPNQSGLGRSSLVFEGDMLNQGEVVTVEAYYGNRLAGRGEVAIPATEPRVVLYPRDALRGVLWGQALPQGIRLASREVTVQAQPLYFSALSAQDDLLQYSWTLNDSDIAGPDSARGLLTLRQTGEGEGSAALGVAVANADNNAFTQMAQTALQIVFGQAQSGLGSLFGL